MSHYTLLTAVTLRSLDALTRILEKGEAYEKEHNLPEHGFLQARLAPDMLPFVSQIRIATDDARRNTYLLAGKEHVKMEDNETTYKELYERIATTKSLVTALTEEDFAGADDRHISLYWMAGGYVFGKDFVQEIAIPNLMFHVVTAYDVLRNQGVPLGKADFIGNFSMHKPE